MLHNSRYFIMNSRQYLFILLLAGVLFSPRAVAQVNDAGLWGSINIEKKFTRKFSLHFSEELRLNENFSELGTIYSELTGEYKFSKTFSLSGGYRFILKRQKEDFYNSRHRYLVNLNVKRKFGKIATNTRVRFQSQYTAYNSSEDGQVPDNYLRTKLGLKYSTGKKYKPFVSGELFFDLNNPDGLLWDNYRASAGIEYEFSVRSNIELGYMIDREVNVSDPLTNYIISIGWNYILK